MAQLLAQGLREDSHEVDIARDGHAALKLTNQNSFDVILLDRNAFGSGWNRSGPPARRREETVLS